MAKFCGQIKNSENINYESAYHNGEAGVVKFLINQMKQAEII